MLTSTDPFILHRQVDLLYRNLRLGQVVSVINAAFLVWVAWNEIPHAGLMTWLAVVCLVAALRGIDGWRYLNLAEAQRRAQAEHWRRHAVMGATAGGCTWMAGALLLMLNSDGSLHYFTAFVMSGMAAGAVPVVAADKLAFRLYAWPIVLAVIVSAWGGEAIQIAFSGMAALFLLIVTRSADYFNESLHETIRLERETALLAEKLELARQLAEQSNRAKSRFLTNISHEIRTPMNAVIGMTELALDADDPTEGREYMRIVKSSAHALMGILNDILDFSRVESGRLVIENLSFSPAEQLAEVTGILRFQAVDKGLKLDCTVAADVPAQVVSDPMRIRQVLTNLIGNAIKFTERGEVVVTLDVQSRNAGGAVLRYAVRDTGIGIATDQLKSVFEAFSQADASNTRKYGGAGLGLSITDRLVRLLGGALEVNSAPGQGSTFSFTLPVGLSDALALTKPDDSAALPESARNATAPTEAFDYRIPAAALDAAEAEILVPAFLDNYQAELQALQQAIAAGNAAEIEIRCLGLKGNLAAFGARPAQERLNELETAAHAGNLAPAATLFDALAEETEKLAAALRSR